jgi:PST family polysaccharide transporter
MHESGSTPADAAAGPEAVVATDAENQRHALTSGVRWTAAAQALTAFLNFGVVIVLAWVLVPADFGLLAMAAAIISIVTALQTLGTHGPLIQREEVSDVLINTVFLLNLVLGVLLMIGLILAAPLLATLYRTPAVEPLIQVIALSLVLYAFSGVPGALLYRRMQFGAVAVTDTLGAILYAVVAEALAWAGYGVWSLVMAMLASAAAEAIFLMWAARFRPRLRFSWHELRGIARYSANMTGVNLLHLVLRNADSLIIGRWLGAGSLGLFGMATRFTRQPVEMFVSSVLEPVLFPAYSRMQQDDALTAKTMQRALAGAAVVMFPVLGGIAAIARPFVDGVLGPDWSPVIVLILLMAPIGMVRTLLATVISLFLARDRTGLLFALRLVGGCALVAAYLLGVQIGLVAVVIALLVAEVLIGAVELTICARLVRIRISTLLAGALGPLAATLLMAGIVFALERFLASQGWADALIVAAAVPVGVLAYTAIVIGFRLRAAHDLVALLPAPLARRIGPLLPRSA